MSNKDKRFNPKVADKARQLIGEFIRDRRKEVGYSQEELANMAQIRQATLSDMETGGQVKTNTLLAVLGVLRGKIFIEWADINSILTKRQPQVYNRAKNKMATKTFTTEKGTITFSAKYFIIQGNNGNHTGYNREWKINSEGYKTKAEANKVYKKMVNENGDIKYGLTPLRIVTADELMEIYEGQEKIKFFNCFDIDVNF